MNTARTASPPPAELAAVHLLASSEPLLLLEAADDLRRRARAQGYVEREVHDVDARFDWDALRASFGAMSLFASRRLIEVRLPSGRPGKEGSALIEAFCADPAPDVLLLITAHEWSRSHETAWVRAVERSGNLQVLWAPRPDQLRGWIAQRLKRHGIETTPEAAALLAERVEGNLLAAAQEIDKLVLLQREGRIDAEAMQSLVADSARFDVFRLTDTALAGDAPHALRMLAGLRGEGQAVVPVLSWIASQVQLLAQLASVQAAGGNVVQAMREAKLWDAKQALFRRALSRIGADQAERLVRDCALVDRQSKGRADGDPWLTLERLLVRLAAPRALPDGAA